MLPKGGDAVYIMPIFAVGIKRLVGGIVDNLGIFEIVTREQVLARLPFFLCADAINFFDIGTQMET